MINQYTEGYGSISSDIQNIIANRVGLLDDYILMQTGQYEYTALIKDNATKKVTEITIARTSGTVYNNYYTVSEQAAADFEFSVSNEYYVYSSLQLGRSLTCPIYEKVTSYGICIFICVLVFAILFKGVLFRCLRK